MPSKTDIYDSLHSKEWWLRYTPAEKAIWYYLITGYRGLSGIWIVTIGEIAFRTGVPADEAQHFVCKKGLHGIRYDEDLSIVFNRRRTHYKLKQGGKPEQNANSIKSDYMATYKAVEFWTEWFDIYQNHDGIASNVFVMDFFHSLNIGSEPTGSLIHTKPVLELKRDERPAEPPAKTDEERELRIHQHLDRYTEAMERDEIDEEDRDLIFEIYKHLMTTKKGEPRTPTVRLRFLDQLAKYPALHVSCGCLGFKEMLQKGRVDIGTGYFFKIMEGGGALKYRKLMHDLDQERGVDSLFK